MTDQNLTIVRWITAAHRSLTHRSSSRSSSITHSSLITHQSLIAAHRSALNLMAAKITQDHLKTSSFVTVSFITLSPSKIVIKI